MTDPATAQEPPCACTAAGCVCDGIADCADVGGDRCGCCMADCPDVHPKPTTDWRVRQNARYAEKDWM